jgi:hypothetical protein
VHALILLIAEQRLARLGAMLPDISLPTVEVELYPLDGTRRSV